MSVTQNEEQRVEADWWEERGDYAEARRLRDQPFVVGEVYFIRLATFAWTGRVLAVGASEIIIDNATCIFDTGPFEPFFERGPEASDCTSAAVEGTVVLGRFALIDGSPMPVYGKRLLNN